MILLLGGFSLKVLITTDFYKPNTNGVVRSVMTLKSALEQQGHEVRVLTLNQTGIVRENDVYILRSISAGKIYPNARIMFGMCRSVVNKIVKWKPDIIHSQCEISTFFFANRIAKKLRIPLVHTYHTVYEDYTHYFSPSHTIGKEIVETLSRKILKHTQAIIAPTEKVKDILTSYKVKPPITVIPTGLDLQKCSSPVDKNTLSEMKHSLGIPEDNTVLLFLGRLAREKNIDETIKLIENCHLNKFTFLIVGDGPDRDRLEKHVKKSSIKNNVIFTGLVPMDSVNAYYQLADLFICSSTSEAQGLTYFEALANGVPALCRKDACLDGVLINYKNGFQYTNEDDFAEFLNFFFSDKCNREDMIANALPVKDKFSSKAFGENVAELYKNTIKKFNEKNSVNYK